MTNDQTNQALGVSIATLEKIAGKNYLPTAAMARHALAKINAILHPGANAGDMAAIVQAGRVQGQTASETPPDGQGWNDQSEIVETIGQAWCLCPFEWGIEDYITIQSSQGQLVLCAAEKVVDGPNRGKLRYEPLPKTAVHHLSENASITGG